MDVINNNVWEYEQDYFTDKYDGYEYVIKRNPSLRILLGYVKLKNRKWKKNYDELEYKLHAHGGITYVGDLGTNAVWVGFDCGHSNDLVPAMMEIKGSRDFVLNMPEFMVGGVYRDLSYVRRECKNLIKQIKELESK